MNSAVAAILPTGTFRATAHGAHDASSARMDGNRVVGAGMAAVLCADVDEQTTCGASDASTTEVDRNRVMRSAVTAILIAWILPLVARGAIIGFTFVKRDRVMVSGMMRNLAAVPLLMTTMRANQRFLALQNVFTCTLLHLQPPFPRIKNL